MQPQGLELDVVDEFIFKVLSEDAGAGSIGELLVAAGSDADAIYSDSVPSPVKYPYIIYQHSANTDTVTTDSVIVLVQAVYMVKVVHRTRTYDSIKPIYARMHALLHKASGTVVDGQVLHCRRERGIRYPEKSELVDYRHRGGTYRFWV